MMKKIASVFLHFIFCWSISTAIDSKELKTKFNQSVAKPYLAAMQLFAYQILIPLAENPPIDTFSEDIENERDLDALKSKISSFEKNLKLLETGLQWLVNLTDKSVKETIEEKSTAKTTLGRIKLNISLIADTSKQLDKQIILYEQQIQTKKEELDLYSIIVEEEKRKFRDFNEQCHFAQEFRDDAACSSLEDKKAKLDQLNYSYKLLTEKNKKLKNDKDQMTKEKEDLRCDKEGIKLNEWKLNKKIDKLHNIQERLANTNVALKGVLMHIGKLHRNSNVLKTTVNDLVDMNVLILPLQHIGNEIVTYAGEQQLGFYPFKDVNDSIVMSVKEICSKYNA